MAKAKKPHEYTTDEVRKKFLDHCAGILDYWYTCDRAPSTREKMEGLLFSVFAAIDGAACDLPAFLLAPLPCKEDKEYCKKEGENWFPFNDEKKVVSDIAGSLHDEYARYMKAEPGQPEEEIDPDFVEALKERARLDPDAPDLIAGTIPTVPKKKKGKKS